MATLIETDVLVVGGSVAGSTAARLLAEAGYRVIVLDKARFPRDKPCGEGVMPTGVRLLDRLGVLRSIAHGEGHTLRGVGFVVQGRERIRGDFPDIGGGYDRGLGVKRLVLDDQLLKHAKAHPRVEVHEGEPATKMVCPPGCLAEISTPSAPYRARVVLGADGARSLVRRMLGLGLPSGRRRRYALRAHFSFRDGRALDDYVTVYCDREAECYTTPVSGTELEVALLVEQRGMRLFAGRHEKAYDAYLGTVPHIRSVIQGGERSSPVLACGPFDVRAQSLVADRAILVGDAGGYLDPITGEGIALALQSAFWAAEVVDDALRCDDLSATRLMPYQLRLERALRHSKILTRAILSLIRHKRLAAWIVRRLASCPEFYSKLLAINCGVRTFWDLGLADLTSLVFGRTRISRLA